MIGSHYNARSVGIEMVSYVDNNVKIIGSISAVWGQRPKLKNVVDIKLT